ncbi:MAG: glycosyltransferase family 4 protein [Paracoccaceae bacterium]|nr:glycosyltransferase family 4 protein [Paracoccaceae bacterium]
MSSALRITFVSRKWPPAMGGIETYAKALSDKLRDHGEIQVIALPGHADGSPPSALRLIGFGIAAGFRLLFAARPAPVVHVADMASWPLAFAARIRRPSGRRVLSAHGTDVSYPLRGGLRGRAYGLYLRLGALLTSPVTVVANSAATAAGAARFGYRDASVVPLAANLPVAGGTPETAGRTILYSGRLLRHKGCSWFIEQVLPRLPADVTLEVAGMVWDEAERAALADPRVRYLGRLDQDALHQHMAAAMCVVVPNIELESGEFEGFGLVAVEASAAGGLVIAARHAGLVEAVRDGETGFLVAPGDVEAWAEAITRIADWTPDRRAAFLRRSKVVCADYYSWARVASETAALYSEPVHDR